MERTEVRISQLKDKTIEIIKSEQWGENRLRKHTGTWAHTHTHSHRSMWDHNKKSNICVFGIVEGEERKVNLKST